MLRIRSEPKRSITRSGNPAPTEVAPGFRCGRSSGDFEIVPAFVHEGRFVHQRVPARYVLDAVEEGATVAHGSGLLHRHPVRILDFLGCGLALVPERPLR